MSEDYRRILEQTRTIAVVGASTDPAKPSHAVPAYLRDVGFDIRPVHPGVEEVLGLPAYASLDEVPGPVDLVEVFRPAAEAPAIARQAVAAGASVLWLQQGITSPEARAIAEDGGLTYVEDRCLGKLAALYGIRKDPPVSPPGPSRPPTASAGTPAPS